MKVVILGAGFGGLEVARRLSGTDHEVVVVDRRNHHLFQPLLYQVATAGLSPADIAAPIRKLLSRAPNVTVRLAEATGVDLDGKRLLTSAGPETYDRLVLAPGSQYGYFGHEAWRPYAPGLKTLADAVEIRRRVLLAFERAEMAPPDQRAAYLTFVVVGGGPTGVELAGALSELAHRALAQDFRRIDPKDTRILLVEGGPRLLASFPEPLSRRAQRDLESLGVEVHLQSPVSEINAEGVRLKESRIPAATVIWAAGVVAAPVARWLGVAPERGGRIPVTAELTLASHPEVYLIGDAALVLDGTGTPLPGVAPVAKQQGAYVARHLLGKTGGKPFRYIDKGNLATIGRSRAVAQVGKWQLSGAVAWLLWVVIHVYYLLDFQNRLKVLGQWAWSYLTYQRGARLITPEGDSEN